MKHEQSESVANWHSKKAAIVWISEQRELSKQMTGCKSLARRTSFLIFGEELTSFLITSTATQCIVISSDRSISTRVGNNALHSTI